MIGASSEAFFAARASLVRIGFDNDPVPTLGDVPEHAVLATAAVGVKSGCRGALTGLRLLTLR